MKKKAGLAMAFACIAGGIALEALGIGGWGEMAFYGGGFGTLIWRLGRLEGLVGQVRDLNKRSEEQAKSLGRLEGLVGQVRDLNKRSEEQARSLGRIEGLLEEHLRRH